MGLADEIRRQVPKSDLQIMWLRTLLRQEAQKKPKQ